MKLIFSLLSFTLMFSFSLSACSDDESKEGQPKSYSIDIKKDIQSFNTRTGEIVLKSGEIVDAMLSSVERMEPGLFSTITFYLDGQVVFESIPIQPEYSSFVVNDLVVVMADTELSLLDGYPSLEVLGPNKTESEKIRSENFAKRKANWDRFIQYLTDAGKIVE